MAAEMEEAMAFDSVAPLPSTFVGVFGEDLSQSLAPEVVSALQEKWNHFHEALEKEKIRIEQENVVKDHKACDLERELDLNRQQLEQKFAENESQVKEMQDLLQRYNEARQKLVSLEETSNSLAVENQSLKREREQLSGERNDLFKLAERRQVEVENLHKDWQNLSNELKEANNAKYEALMKAEDVQSREVTLQYKEKRIEEEREYLNNQVSSLTEELQAKNEEIYSGQREQITKIASLQSENTRLSENLKLAEGKLEAVKEDNEEFQKKIFELTDKLKASRESILKTEEGYRQELKAQTNLAQLYKGHCDESEKKAQDFGNAVEELQGLLKESSKRYGDLEDNMEKEKAEHKEEIKRRNEAIRTLKKELENANELINNMRKRGLTTEEIEKLSPSAAAASRLLKSGMTLTQIYSQLVSAQDELTNAKDENVRLSSYMDQILQEIEERAPALKQQREDYENAVNTVHALSNKLEDARQEYEFRKREAGECRQRAATVSRKNERLQQQVQDLNKQVTILVREVEVARTGGLNLSSSSRINSSSSDLNMTGDADSIINDRLLTFHDLSELQQRNIELLAVVRELSSNQEMTESRLVEEKTTELKADLEKAVEQVEELCAARKRQEVMVESIIVERDMYKARLEAAAADPLPTQTGKSSQSPTAKNVVSSFHDLEKRAVTAEATLAEVQKEFNTYRTEKCENEKLSSEELERCRKDLNEARAKSIKLASQEEYNTERFKVAQTNATSFRKQVSLLEERSNKLNGIIVKHEQTIDILRNEILKSQSKLSHAEVRLDTLRQENAVLKGAEKRLLQENEVLHRQKTNSSLVMENLNLIKLNLERAEEEKQMRLQNKVDELENEVVLLRKKLDREQEDNKQSVKAWETAQKELSVKLEEAREKEKEALTELEGHKIKLEQLSNQLRETQIKLETAESANAARGVHAVNRQDSQPEVSAKTRDLQMQLTQAKNEISNLKEQLANSRSASAQYKDIADSAEKRLAESSNAAKALKDDLESRLAKALEQKNQLEVNLEEATKKANESGKENNSVNDLKKVIETTQNNLEHVTNMLQLSQANESNLTSELEKQVALATEAQQRYQSELMNHAQDIETLNNLKMSVTSHNNQVRELEQTKAALEEALSAIKEQAQANEISLRNEQEKLQDQFAIVERENKVIHEQLATVTQQMASLHKKTEGNPDANRSFSEDESKSTEQLMQIIKYLRREKEILASKVEVTQAESTRVKSQLENVEKALAETSASLNADRERNATKAMSSSKYDELLQKVQTASALSDSNKMLREENLRLTEELTKTLESLKKTTERLEPLEEKMRTVEETESTLKVEAEAAKQECERWRTRANQLVEKQQKVNPDELKRLQNDNSTLTKQLNTSQLQLKQAQQAATTSTNKIKATEASLTKLTNDFKAKVNECQLMIKEMQKLKAAYATATNKINALNAKINELEATNKQVAFARDSLKQELETKSGDTGKIAQELGTIKKQVETKTKENEALAARNKELVTNVNKVKQIARKFKETSETQTKELNVLKPKLTSLEEELKKANEAVAAANAAAAAASTTSTETSTSAGINENLAKLQKEHDDLKAEKEQADELLETIQEEINNHETEKETLTKESEELRSEVETYKTKCEKFKNILQKLRDQGKINEDPQQLENQLNALQAEKEAIKVEFEKEKKSLHDKISSLEQDIENYQKQLEGNKTNPPQAAEKPPSETMTASVKPMAGQQPVVARKQQVIQPQAHIQPTRHMPATATIRPQRGTVVVRASPSSTATDVPQISVQPTIVAVSPSSSSGQQQPQQTVTTSSVQQPLNPSASEFVPMQQQDTAAASAEVETEEAPPLRAMVIPVQPDVEPEAVPSTSGTSGSTASVPPGPKRVREGEDTDVATESKRARTTNQESSTIAAPLDPSTVTDENDEIVVLSSDEEGESEAEEPLVEDEEEVDEVGEEEEADNEDEEEMGEDLEEQPQQQQLGQEEDTQDNPITEEDEPNEMDEIGMDEVVEGDPESAAPPEVHDVVDDDNDDDDLDLGSSEPIGSVHSADMGLIATSSSGQEFDDPRETMETIEEQGEVNLELATGDQEERGGNIEPQTQEDESDVLTSEEQPPSTSASLSGSVPSGMSIATHVSTANEPHIPTTGTQVRPKRVQRNPIVWDATPGASGGVAIGGPPIPLPRGGGVARGGGSGLLTRGSGVAPRGIFRGRGGPRAKRSRGGTFGGRVLP